MLLIQKSNKWNSIRVLWFDLPLDIEGTEDTEGCKEAWQLPLVVQGRWFLLRFRFVEAEAEAGAGAEVVEVGVGSSFGSNRNSGKRSFHTWKVSKF